MEERVFLTRLQYEFPLTAQPFAALAQASGASAEQVMAQLRAWLERGTLRTICGLFDARRLGYHSTLVAAHIPETSLETAAAGVSAYPGVSHNYARRHYYNLWFTLTVPDAADAGQVAAALLPGTALDEILLLPAVRFFKLDARFALGEEPAAEGNLAVPQDGGTRFAPTLLDRQAIHWLGQDLPLEERPFAALAEQAGLSEEALLERAQFYLREGIMRRYGAVLNHRRAGFSANGMTGWIVPAARVEAVGQLFAGYREVSHCYERPTYPGWPYNVFTMIHAATEQDVEAIVGRMAQAADVEQYAILFSTKEFKKKPISFFTVRLGFMGFKPHQVPGKRW